METTQEAIFQPGDNDALDLGGDIGGGEKQMNSNGKYEVEMTRCGNRFGHRA